MRIPLAAITDFLSDTSSLTAAVPAGLLQANDKVYYRQAPGLRRGAVWHRPTCRPSAHCTSGVWAFLVYLTLNYLTVGYAVTQDLGMLDGIDFDNA